MRRIMRQSNVEQIKRGPGRPRKYPLDNNFATLNLAHRDSASLTSSGQMSCEWTRAVDGAQMRMTLPVPEAAKLVEAFLLGGVR